MSKIKNNGPTAGSEFSQSLAMVGLHCSRCQLVDNGDSAAVRVSQFTIPVVWAAGKS